MLDASTNSLTDDELTAVMAYIRHELRTPLNHILGYSELLIEQAEEEGRKDLIVDLEKIREAGRQLLGLLRLILTPDGMAHRLHTPTGTDGTGGAKTLTQEIMEGGQPSVPSLLPPTLSDAADKSLEKPMISADNPLLVVDDDPNNREVLVRLLQQMGYKVVEAADGKEALDVLRTTWCDVVFLDVMMPVVDGYQTLQAVRNDEELCHIPVIMVSALDELQVVARCIEAGAEDYLSKPFNLTLLKARLTATLEKKQWRDQERELFAQLAEANERLHDAALQREGITKLLLQDLRAMVDLSEGSAEKVESK